MIKRTLSAKTLSLAKSFPVLTLTGPRQSGKTTETLHPDLFRGLRHFQSLSAIPQKRLFLVHGGPRKQSRKYDQVLSWRNLAPLLQGTGG